MSYDFDEIVPRLDTDCVKWDGFAPGTIPMWVADMDFKAAPAILQALQKRLDHGVFGYERLPREYFDAITGWFSRRHDWSFSTESIIPTTGVIAAYSASIKAMTSPGDKVILMTPVYNCFFPAVRNNRCVETDCSLVYHEGKYSIDFEDLERKASDPLAKVLLLCNPHNPVGRVWTREELLRIAGICHRNGVFVISDEIHCELTRPGLGYTPYGTLPREYVLRSATCVSPTKPFNIAGIQIANVVAADPEVRRRIDRALNENECCDVNVFGPAALIAAYNRSEGWLDELREYLWDNYQYTLDFLRDNIPGITVPPLEGTYLMWLDCRFAAPGGIPQAGFSDSLSNYLKDSHGVVLTSGTVYGRDGEGFLRLNIACPRKTLTEGLRRLAKGINLFINTHN